MRALWADLQFAVRLLVKSPGFAATAVLTLILGIVLNTAAFGVVNALWFRPLPFQDGEQIVIVRASNPSLGLSGLMSYHDYSDVHARIRSFEGMAALADRAYNLTIPVPGAEPERVHGGVMSASTLDLLGYRPLLGRGFTPEDDGASNAASGPRGVLISEGLWRNRFGADSGIIGRDLKIDGSPATILGVLPHSFRFIYGGYQVLAPLPRDVMETPRDNRSLQVLARVRRATPLAQVQAELGGLSEGLAALHPASNSGWTIRAAPFRKAVFGQAMRMYPILLAAAGLVLLIVCANISNLLLAKLLARRKELAIRMALGAGRMRVVRQLLTEGMLIAGCGGALALVAAAWTRGILVAQYPELAVFQVDHRVAAYTLCASLAAALMFALAPALSASGADLNSALKASGQGAGGGGGRLRGVLVVSQLAFALMLLAGTGLLVKAIASLRNIDTGLELSNVLATEVSLQGAKYSTAERQTQFWRQIAGRLSALPGVQAAAVAGHAPLLASALPQRIEVAGRQIRAGGEYVRLASSVVDDRYLDTVGIRLVAGRGFTPADRAGAPPVVIVNEALAKLMWPAGPSAALGQRLKVAGQPDWSTVVGVARNARQLLPEAPGPELMAPSAQSPLASMTLLVRTASVAPASMTEAVRREVRALDPDLPLGEALTWDGIVEKFYPKVMIGGLGMFSAVAIALAALGLCGVVSSLASSRTREIAVRVALGAPRRQILRMVVWQGLRLALVGVAVGLAGAFALARVLSAFLYGVNPGDTLVFAGVALILTLVAVTASSIPAWRASRVDPMVALRCE